VRKGTTTEPVSATKGGTKWIEQGGKKNTRGGLQRTVMGKKALNPYFKPGRNHFKRRETRIRLKPSHHTHIINWGRGTEKPREHDLLGGVGEN